MQTQGNIHFYVNWVCECSEVSLEYLHKALLSIVS
jgi:hypothetical protein